jgi:hypothetical protein
MLMLRLPVGGNGGAQGRVGAGFDGKIFLTVFRGMVTGGAKKDGADLAKLGNQLFLVRLDSRGKRLDALEAPVVLHDGAVPGANPAVAGGPPGTFLVCYEVDGGPGKHRVVARLVRVR